MIKWLINGGLVMLKGKITAEGYTFDDLLLVPSYSEVVPIQVKLETKLTKKSPYPSQYYQQRWTP